MADEEDEQPPEVAPPPVEPTKEEPKQPVKDVEACRKVTPDEKVLKITPRSGRYIPPPDSDCDRDKPNIRPPPETSRDYRIYKALNTREWGEICECHGDRDHAAMDLLAAAITTVMLMAANYEGVSENQMRWTAKYLECIKDDYGHTPPNIRGILNLIYTKVPKDSEETPASAQEPAPTPAPEPPAEEEAAAE